LRPSEVSALIAEQLKTLTESRVSPQGSQNRFLEQPRRERSNLVLGESPRWTGAVAGQSVAALPALTVSRIERQTEPSAKITQLTAGVSDQVLVSLKTAVRGDPGEGEESLEKPRRCQMGAMPGRDAESAN
jgi:hypothetical protein